MESANDGRTRYGLRRYLFHEISTSPSKITPTHDAATRVSLKLLCTFCLDRQILTRAYAPKTSFNVHSTEANRLELGNIVVNTDSRSGDWTISLSLINNRTTMKTYVSKWPPRVWIYVVFKKIDSLLYCDMLSRQWTRSFNVRRTRTLWKGCHWRGEKLIMNQCIRDASKRQPYSRNGQGKESHREAGQCHCRLWGHLR